MPASISRVIRTFILASRSWIPDSIRTGRAWRKLIQTAIPSTGDADIERHRVLFDWLWTDALPLFRPIADSVGKGTEWSAMIETRSHNHAHAAAIALDPRTADSRRASTTLASYAAQTLMETCTNNPHDPSPATSSAPPSCAIYSRKSSRPSSRITTTQPGKASTHSLASAASCNGSSPLDNHPISAPTAFRPNRYSILSGPSHIPPASSERRGASPRLVF